MIKERLKALREQMRKRDISIYVVPTADFHESEYVGEYFKARKFITGFTGSAGVAVITMDEAGLWTDGRYFVQAEKQLQGTTVDLYKMGEENVPTVNEFIENKLSEEQTIGFDGRVVNATWGRELECIANRKNGKIYSKEDLIDLIWKDRPSLSKEKAWILKEEYSGESTQSKLKRLRDKMKEKKATVHLMSSLYDISWLLNVRGNDISYVPVVLSYLAVTEDECIWFLQEEIIDDELKVYLEANNITTKPYESFYEYVATIKKRETVLVNLSAINYRVASALDSEIKIVNEIEPTTLFKAIKNKTEIDNTRRAHVKDAVAMCKFMYWLKTNVGKIPMTEISASDHLEKLRREQEGLLDLSFNTICGYDVHGAIVHYAATKETDIPLEPRSFLLVDSGGHYIEGTTDITRTFALGEVTQEMKECFTMICRSNMNLANMKFLYGCTGLNLDLAAREPLWEKELDFKHGTGHGVGYVLNVHEGPNGFRWRQVAERNDGGVLEEGMITTDEPGVYLEGKFGIRTENELVCCKGVKNEYGQFMYFENITYVPIDLDAIDPDLMTSVEKNRLNEYHKRVYEVVSPYLEGDELEFLKKYTRAI
ncbi:aminopeptidase P family protein [Lachnobacterium bovis]|uniref:Xaa-Pro aminopeptidase n=1 Tax=Lachnobacterium bovis DSM 14045 TaxID=1122142 RepID=A0A1H3LK28_9FIRM|nr:aminopeptidase P family protein [Lachnobacterium bovis]SDY64696.1 Xaa-Pro aminopeptidase [Lachnobacterium bovis DSM 14045]